MFRGFLQVVGAVALLLITVAVCIDPSPPARGTGWDVDRKDHSRIPAGSEPQSVGAERELRPGAIGRAVKRALRPQWRVARRYRKDGRSWAAVVIRPGASVDTVLAVARTWHEENPTTSAHIFDDESLVPEYVAWTINYPDPMHPFPEAWDRQHRLAMVNRMLARGGPTWRLVPGRAYPGPLQSIDL